MRRTYLLKKDLFTRRNYSSREYFQLYLKYLQSRADLALALRVFCNKKFQKYSINSSRVLIVNRCTISNRASWVYRFSRLSRMELKRQIGVGMCCGIRKSSW